MLKQSKQASKQPLISLIAAISQNRVLADTKNPDYKYGMPWHLPTDLKRFKQTTSRHPVILGRKTYTTFNQPLLNRTNIIVTKNPDFKAFGCTVVHDLNTAIEWAKATEREEIFILGGGQIYSQAMNIADKLYLTLIKQDFEGDVFFPKYDHIFNKIVFKESHTENGLNFDFIDLVKSNN